MLRQLLRGAARARRPSPLMPAAGAAREGCAGATTTSSSTSTVVGATAASLSSSSAASSSLDALAGRLGRMTLRRGRAAAAAAEATSPPAGRLLAAPAWLRAAPSAPSPLSRALSTRSATATATDGAAPPPPPPPPPSSASAGALPPNLELAVPEAIEAFKPVDAAEVERRLHLLQGAVPPAKLTVPVLSSLTDGKLEGNTLRLDPRVFAVPVRRDVVHRVLTWQRAKRRLGLAMTKRVGDIRGSTKKYRPQKGSGRARAGKKHAPQFRGGYKPHGPVQRDFGFKLNKKVRALGLRVALSAKLREGNLVIVEHLQLPEGRTKVLESALKQYDWAADAEGRRRRVLFIDGEDVGEAMALAVRNLPYAKALPQVGANVLDVVQAEVLVLSQAAAQALTARLLP